MILSILLVDTVVDYENLDDENIITTTLALCVCVCVCVCACAYVCVHCGGLSVSIVHVLNLCQYDTIFLQSLSSFMLLAG